jgi:hypothetical protein
MDPDEQSRLHAERSRLECTLLATEKALDALAAGPDGQDERARLTAELDAQLTELGVVNTRLSTLRGHA